ADLSTGSCPLTTEARRGNSYIGAPIERVEDLRFLRGRGEYIDDVRRDGLWHAVIFRSSVAHARIKSIDLSAALAMPGVRAVFTGSISPRSCRSFRFACRGPNSTPARRTCSL